MCRVAQSDWERRSFPILCWRTVKVTWSVGAWLWTQSTVHSHAPFGSIEEHKWFDQIYSQWEFQKNWFIFISFDKIQFLPPCIWNLPFMSYSYRLWSSSFNDGRMVSISFPLWLYTVVFALCAQEPLWGGSAKESLCRANHLWRPLQRGQPQQVQGQQELHSYKNNPNDVLYLHLCWSYSLLTYILFKVTAYMWEWWPFHYPTGVLAQNQHKNKTNGNILM